MPASMLNAAKYAQHFGSNIIMTNTNLHLTGSGIDIFWQVPGRHIWCLAELLDVLRISVETRKTQLVDAALDCVQRLISHGLLSGPVQSINHRREAASKAAGAKKKQGDDDDDGDAAVQGPMPPQVVQPSLVHIANCNCQDCVCWMEWTICLA